MKTAQALVDEVVRPLIAADGGTVDVIALEPALVHLRLGASCAGCPGRTHTKAQVLEPLFRSVLGADVEVRID